MKWHLVAIAASACGSHPSRFITITNGGVATVRGPCVEIAMAVTGGDVAPVRVGEPACATEVDEIVVGAAGVYWRIGDAPALGPLPANAATIQIPYVTPLESGEGSHALTSGTNTKRLSSGERTAGLASTETKKSLGSGNDARKLGTGSDARRLAATEQRRGLGSGNDTRKLAGSEQSRALGSGETSKGVAPTPTPAPATPTVRLKKSVDRSRLAPGAQAEFSLELANEGEIVLTRVVVFDRVPRALAVVGTDGTTLALPDGSTLVTWTRSALGAKARAMFKIRVELRRG